MSEILRITLPFFGLLFLGFGAGRGGHLSGDALKGLTTFVSYFALPALFFQLVATTPAHVLPGWSFVLTTTFATYCAFAIAFSFGALINRGNVPEATMQGLVGSSADIGFLGPALAIAAFGRAAGAPIALIFTFDSIMLFALVPLMMALGRTDRADALDMVRTIGRRIFLHPAVVATLAGLLASLVGLQMPAPIDALLTLLRAAAAPAAVFLVGATLARRNLDRVPFDLPVLVAVKLFVHPLIVYLLLGWLGGFDPVWVRTAVLLAALPPAAHVFRFAKQYDTYVEQASAATLAAAIVSIATLTIAVILIVGGILPVTPFR